MRSAVGCLGAHRRGEGLLLRLQPFYGLVRSVPRIEINDNDLRRQAAGETDIRPGVAAAPFADDLLVIRRIQAAATAGEPLGNTGDFRPLLERKDLESEAGQVEGCVQKHGSVL